MNDNDLLRHTLATLAYRGNKAVRDAPETFAEFRASAVGRTSVQILAHIGDLFEWALSIAEGQQRWRNASPLPWDREVARFHTALQAFDNYLASGKPLQVSAEKLFQGPIADAFTHVGQLAMLRRLAGAPIKGENYFVADIAVGRTGAEQARANREFD